MIGFVDLHGRALIEIRLGASDIAARHDVQAWIDTGFTGDLVLPQQMIDDLELPPSGTVKAALADGSVVTMERYCCHIDWFGSERELEVVANAGERPLLGVGLLIGLDLNISYRFPGHAESAKGDERSRADFTMPGPHCHEEPDFRIAKRLGRAAANRSAAERTGRGRDTQSDVCRDNDHRTFNAEW